LSRPARWGLVRGPAFSWPPVAPAGECSNGDSSEVYLGYYLSLKSSEEIGFATALQIVDRLCALCPKLHRSRVSIVLCWNGKKKIGLLIFQFAVVLTSFLHWELRFHHMQTCRDCFWSSHITHWTHQVFCKPLQGPRREKTGT